MKKFQEKAIAKLDKDRFGDLRYYVSDYSKFQNATGWKPEIMPKEGITNLIKWIQKMKICLLLLNKFINLLSKAYPNLFARDVVVVAKSK